jgi:nucleoside-diphosphate kinase
MIFLLCIPSRTHTLTTTSHSSLLMMHYLSPSVNLFVQPFRVLSPVIKLWHSTLYIYIYIIADTQRGIVGNIISRFEQKGYRLAALKTKVATSELLEQHYQDLVQKPFFPKMKDYMMSGPVVCMVWEGKEAVTTGRKMLGATNPLESAPGTIRGDFCIEVRGYSYMYT